MASKKSKPDLLVRVRYHNPLAPPPFPSKLLNIPTDPARYAGLDYTAQMANDMLFPMVADAEMGMPLDLTIFRHLWQERGDPTKLNPDPNNLPDLEPEDQALLDDAIGGSQPQRLSQSAQGSSVPQVSWLRRTEYLSQDFATRSPSSQRLLEQDAPVTVDISREAQIRDIQETFPSSLAPVDLSTYIHPLKPGLRAVSTYDVFADPETVSNMYDILRFAERPGERPIEQEDPRLTSGILRPMKTEDEQFLAYFLPRSDEDAAEYMQRREIELQTGRMYDGNHMEFDFVRDYELFYQEPGATELLLMVDEGDLPVHVDVIGSQMPANKRAKGAYIQQVARRMRLKRRRVARDEVFEYGDKWDTIQMSHRPLTREEWQETRENDWAELNDPVLAMQKAQEDGDAEDDPDAMPMKVPKYESY